MQNTQYLKYIKTRSIKSNQIYFSQHNQKMFKNERFKTFFRANNSFDNNPIIEEGGKRIKNLYRKSLKNKPLITIITVVLNHAKELDTTIKSVILQNYSNLEYIIIDGGSSDNTIPVIKKYENHIDYWLSQKDAGIFDAFNKGLKLSSGDYICILNSGDYFTENSINFIVKKILEKKDLDILFGTVLKKKKFSGFYPDKIFFNLNIIPSLMSTFVKLSIYKEIGLFDTNLAHYGDYDFFYKCIKKKDIKWYATKKNKVITVFDLKGYSSKASFFSKLYSEYKVRIKYENFLMVIFKLAIKTLRYIQIKIFSKKKFSKYN